MLRKKGNLQIIPTFDHSFDGTLSDSRLYNSRSCDVFIKFIMNENKTQSKWTIRCLAPYNSGNTYSVTVIYIDYAIK